MKPLSNQPRNSIFSTTLKAAALLGVALGSTLVTERAASGQCPSLSSIPDSQKEAFPNHWVTHVSVTTKNIFNVTVTLEGSGILVSPHVVLLPASMLHQRGDHSNPLALESDTWIGSNSDYMITPALSRSGSILRAPFGWRRPFMRMKSSTFLRGNSSKTAAKYKYNWGGLKFCTPFPDLGTGMPVKFENLSVWNTKKVDIAGYRESNLDMLKLNSDEPSIMGEKRWIRQRDFNFSNMLAGAGAWRTGTTSTDLVGLFTFVHSNCEVRGPRFNDVGLREDSIRDFMRWTPENELHCIGQISIFPRSFHELLYHVLNQQPEMLIPLEQLKLSRGGEGQSDQYSARTMQVIEHTFYEWLEFPVNLQDPESPRAIRLLEPENRWLEIEEAQALLSASRNWVIFNPPTLDPALIEVDESIEIADSMTTFEPDDEFEDQDEDPIDEWLIADNESQFDPADLNQDGSVNGADLATLLGQWGNQGGSGDLNGNGFVEGGDLAMLLGRWR